MSEVFDLDALAAEAKGEPFRFKFGGEEYELPPSVNIIAIAYAQEGKLGAALRALMTPEQWARVKALFHAALAYYYANKEQIDAELDEDARLGEQLAARYPAGVLPDAF